MIKKGIELKIATENAFKKEVLNFLEVFLPSKDKIETAKNIIYLYTCESPFYKLVNAVLRNLNENDILECQIWIKAMNLALKIVDNSKRNENIFVLYRCFSNTETDVLETYKLNMAICFPSFMSTSADNAICLKIVDSKSKNKYIQFKIRIDTSLKNCNLPIDISQISRYKIEKEFLFPSFSKFYIFDTKIEENCYRIILKNKLNLFFLNP